LGKICHTVRTNNDSIGKQAPQWAQDQREEKDQRTLCKEISKKDMWTAGFK